MTVKFALLAAALVPVLASAKPPPIMIVPGLSYPLVYQVICSDGTKGTGFRTSDTQVLSVAHVTDVPCSIQGKPADVTLQDGKLDFSIIRSPMRGANGIRINCDGFLPGEWYFAVGYANGMPWQTVVPLFATIIKDGGQRVLRNSAIPGMSGGPILNARGEAVGTVNAKHIFAPLTYSLELKDTQVCADA